MSFIKLDSVLIQNRMRLRQLADADKKVKYCPDYNGIEVGGVFDSGEDGKLLSELVYNQNLSVPLDVSVHPMGGAYPYVVVVVPHPRLFEVATLSYPSHLIPGMAEPVQPCLQLRGLKKFDLSTLPYIATLHLMPAS